MAAPDVRLESETFTETGAALAFKLPVAEAESLIRMVGDITSGRAEITA